MSQKVYTTLTVNGREAEHRVRITSGTSLEEVYVQRLVKSSDRWGRRRYRVKREALRIVEDSQ